MEQLTETASWLARAMWTQVGRHRDAHLWGLGETGEPSEMPQSPLAEERES